MIGILFKTGVGEHQSVVSFWLESSPRADVSLNHCSGCFSVAFQFILPNKPKIQVKPYWKSISTSSSSRLVPFLSFSIGKIDLFQGKLLLIMQEKVATHHLMDLFSQIMGLGRPQFLVSFLGCPETWSFPLSRSGIIWLFYTTTMGIVVI